MVWFGRAYEKKGHKEKVHTLAIALSEFDILLAIFGGLNVILRSEMNTFKWTMSFKAKFSVYLSHYIHINNGMVWKWLYRVSIIMGIWNLRILQA